LSNYRCRGGELQTKYLGTKQGKGGKEGDRGELAERRSSLSALVSRDYMGCKCPTLGEMGNSLVERKYVE